jgi:hypothetical protein
MNKMKFAILLIVIMLNIALVKAQDGKPKVAIMLKRTACLGTCPIYTITIYDNGDVVYNGEMYVDITGEQKSHLDPATVTQMVKVFEDAGYFGWKDAYDKYVLTDGPFTQTSVTSKGKTHQIERYAYDDTVPLALPYLENWIDIVTNSSLWTGQPTPTIAFGFDDSSPETIPILSLKRDACYGKCPVYNLVVYKGGTIVRTGIANVDKIGVSVVKVDASSVEGVVQQAQALGYFEWQNAYDKIVKTDQATSTTSIRSEDQTKEIVRYNGDPNAPVGLTWVENSIDQLVTNATG